MSHDIIIIPCYDVENVFTRLYHFQNVQEHILWCDTCNLYESRVRLSYEGAYFSTMIKFMHVSDSSNTCMYTTIRKGVPNSEARL